MDRGERTIANLTIANLTNVRLTIANLTIVNLTIVNPTTVNLRILKQIFCHQVRDSHMAAAAKPPDFAPQVDEEDIEVSDTCVEIFFYSGYFT